jgi:hypothetical protein
MALEGRFLADQRLPHMARIDPDLPLTTDCFRVFQFGEARVPQQLTVFRRACGALLFLIFHKLILIAHGSTSRRSRRYHGVGELKAKQAFMASERSEWQAACDWQRNPYAGAQPDPKQTYD